MKARKIDGNQNEIVKYFRSFDISVAITSALGDGFPDLVLGYRGHNFLVEIKDGSLSPSRQKLTEKEQQFKDGWKGQYKVISSLEEAREFVLHIYQYTGVLSC